MTLIIGACALSACRGSSDGPESAQTIAVTSTPSPVSTRASTIVATATTASPPTAPPPHTDRVVVATTAPLDATAPPNEPYWFDTGTVPQLVESADVLTLVVDHDDGSRVTAEFGTSEAGWAVVKLSHDERPIAGAGALDSARLEGAGAIAMLPDGAVVVALVGASDLPRDNVVIYASPDRPLDSVATGVWTQYDNRLVLLAIIPAGATRIDVGGVTPNTATIYELPTDPSEFPPASANQAPP